MVMSDSWALLTANPGKCAALSVLVIMWSMWGLGTARNTEINRRGKILLLIGIVFVLSRLLVACYVTTQAIRVFECFPWCEHKLLVYWRMN